MLDNILTLFYLKFYGKRLFKSNRTLDFPRQILYNLGLDRISEILDLLLNPQDKLKIIHVAGTNGKGSVCAIIASVLKQAGMNVGLYTSPHIFEYTERIKINGKDISKEDFSKYVFEITKLADQHNIHLTEFEVLTAVMLSILRITVWMWLLLKLV